MQLHNSDFMFDGRKVYGILFLEHIFLLIYCDTIVVIIEYVTVIDREHVVACCTGCNASCPLDKFIELTQANIPADWHAECKTSVISNS